NESDQQKMLHAMLLSQYRKYVARDHGVDLKPIILFKSNKIATSKEANYLFFDIVENLTVSDLEQVIRRGAIIHRNSKSVWHKMFIYYDEQPLAEIIRDLQWDFTEETTINANS